MHEDLPDAPLPDGPEYGQPAAATTGFAYDDPGETQRASASGFLLDSLRRRPAGRSLISALTVVLFLSGAGMFMYPFFTDIYTTEIVQERLQDEFDRIVVDAPSYDDWEQNVSGETGSVVTMIALPDIDIETLVVEGTSPAALRAGAGHYPNTPLPGQVGNVAIAGHRTTYGRPFNRIDELPIGAEIWLVTPVGDHLYRVADPDEAALGCTQPSSDLGGCVTDPKNWTVIDRSPDPILTLTTCHPKGSAAQRLIIRAELEESFPAGTYQQRKAA